MRSDSQWTHLRSEQKTNYLSVCDLHFLSYLYPSHLTISKVQIFYFSITRSNFLRSFYSSLNLSLHLFFAEWELVLQYLFWRPNPSSHVCLLALPVQKSFHWVWNIERERVVIEFKVRSRKYDSKRSHWEIATSLFVHLFH